MALIFAVDGLEVDVTHWVLAGLVGTLGLFLIVLLGFRARVSIKKGHIEIEQAELEHDSNLHRKQDSDKEREKRWEMVERLERELNIRRELYEKEAEERADLRSKYEALYLKNLECEQNHRELEARLAAIESRQ